MTGRDGDVSDVLIEDCTITQVSFAAQIDGRIRSGVVLRGNNASVINSSLFRFNTDLRNDTILVEYNNVAEYRGIGAPHGSGLSIRNNNMTIRGNIIRAYGGSGGIRFYPNVEDTGAVPEGGYSNILCEGNLIYGSNVSTGVYATCIGHDFIFRNNTFVSKWGRDPALSGRWRYGGTVSFGLDPAGTGQNVKIHNNILLGIVGITQSLIDAGLQADHNLMWTFTIGKLNFQSRPLGNNSILVCSGYDPHAPFHDTYFETPGTFFVGGGAFANAFDRGTTTPNLDNAFRLVENAVARNVGSSTQASPSCLEGLPRTDATNTVPDLGAYEYRSGTPTNWAPVLETPGSRTVAINGQLSFPVTATDMDGDTLTYSATGLPSGATFSGQTFSWTPTSDQVGTYQVAFAVTDGQFSDSETVTITVEGSGAVANNPPSFNAINVPPANENAPLTISVSASDPDGDPITYSTGSLPSGASFSGQSLTWTPTYEQSGVYQVTFTASDGTSEATETISITVANVNRAPVLTSLSDQSSDGASPLTFAVAAADPDGDTLTYSASGLPSGATFVDGGFSWTPAANQIGAYDITFAVSDGELQDSESVTLYIVGTGPDTTAPTVTRCNPEPAAIQVVTNNLVTLHVTDSGHGVEAGSVVIQVDGNVIFQGDVDVYTSDTGKCTRSGTWGDYRFIYQHDAPFGFDHTVTVTVSAADRAGNVLTDYSHSFTTEMRAFGSNGLVSDGAGPKGHPATVADTAGNIWAIWETGADGNRDIYVSVMAAQTGAFAAPVALTTSVADQCNPDLALAPDGQLYAVWQDNSDGNWDIYLATSANGTTWSRPELLVSSDDNQTQPVIAIDAQSPCRIYVAWQDDRHGGADIYVASSTNAFADDATLRLTPAGSDQLDPDIAVDGLDVAYVVWTDMRNGQADLYGAASGASEWLNVPIVSASSAQTSPALAADPSTSALHLVWVDDALGHRDIYYASCDGLPANPIVGASIIDDTSGADQLEPAIACGDSLNVFACWQDLRHSTDTDLFLAEVGLGTAKTNILIGDNSSNTDQGEPALGIDSHGNPYAVWTDSRDTQTEIYYAATTFINPVPLDSKLVIASEGATIGPDPSTIDEPSDVSLIVPPGACQSDVRITIAEILNPQAMPVECLGSYDFGPSGIDFDEPVTVTIPYRFNGNGNSAKPYWYDSLTGALSTQGITDIQNIVVAADLNALQFKTTHFTPFYLMAAEVETADSFDSESSGGCSVSPTGTGSPKELLVPYGLIAVVMVALRFWDRKKRRCFGTPRG